MSKKASASKIAFVFKEFMAYLAAVFIFDVFHQFSFRYGNTSTLVADMLPLFKNYMFKGAYFIEFTTV